MRTRVGTIALEYEDKKGFFVRMYSKDSGTYCDQRVDDETVGEFMAVIGKIYAIALRTARFNKIVELVKKQGIAGITEEDGVVTIELEQPDEPPAPDEPSTPPPPDPPAQ